jgi:hypothetical protein
MTLTKAERKRMAGVFRQAADIVLVAADGTAFQYSCHAIEAADGCWMMGVLTCRHKQVFQDIYPETHEAPFFHTFTDEDQNCRSLALLLAAEMVESGDAP